MIRCIIAEDEAILRRGLILTTDWQSLDCEVIGEAENGRRALELFRRLKPDLVITDIRMPLMDGLELIGEAKKYHDAEFLIMSGYNDFEYARQAVHLGVGEYLCKPIEEEELAEAVRQVQSKLEKRKQLLLKQLSAGARALPHLPYVEEHPFKPEPGGRYIQEAIRYIEVHYMEQLSVKDVCKSLLISESYLTKLFKEKTGYSFLDYLTRCRVRKACELLADPKVRVYTVAEQVGYRDQRYFSVIFKKTVGLTPKQYREMGPGRR